MPQGPSPGREIVTIAFEEREEVRVDKLRELTDMASEILR